MVTVWCDPTREVWLDTQKEYKGFIEWKDLWDEKGLFHTYADSKISPAFILLSPDNEVVKIIKAARFKKIIKILNKL